MNSGSDVYQMVKFLNNFRNRIQIWNLPQVQRYADDQFYAFTRGNYFFAFTNQDGNFSRNITYHPYSNGTKLCNIYDKNDNVTVNNGQFNVSMGSGNFKIFEICSNLNKKEGGYLSEFYKKIMAFFKRFVKQD